MKKTVALILIVLALIFSGCKNAAYEIYYTVTSPSEYASVQISDYITPFFYTGLPYTSPVSKHFAGNELGVYAWYPDYSNPVTINIYKDGTLWKTKTSSAGDAVVDTGGVL